MKFFALAALFASTVSSIAVDGLIPGARVIPANDVVALKKVGAHHHKHPHRRTVIIRPSCNDNDDVSADFLWGIKKANRGGRLLLQKGKKYVIGKKLDLTFLKDIEVQLDGELKVPWPKIPDPVLAGANTVESSPMTCPTGKQTISIMTSRSPSASGAGVVRTSRSLVPGH
jgi:galacturan 1,4-alpha-galacturonidase